MPELTIAPNAWMTIADGSLLVGMHRSRGRASIACLVEV
jgi:hypothetical protein